MGMVAVILGELFLLEYGGQIGGENDWRPWTLGRQLQ